MTVIATEPCERPSLLYLRRHCPEVARILDEHYARAAASDKAFRDSISRTVIGSPNPRAPRFVPSRICPPQPKSEPQRRSDYWEAFRVGPGLTSSPNGGYVEAAERRQPRRSSRPGAHAAPSPAQQIAVALVVLTAAALPFEAARLSLKAQELIILEAATLPLGFASRRMVTRNRDS
jgi:hypothetical protein